MSRVLLQYLLPLILPLAVYVTWNWLSGGRKATLSETMAKGPWFWLILAGFGLMVAGLAATAVLTSDSPDAPYSPPRFEDGRIVN